MRFNAFLNRLVNFFYPKSCLICRNSLENNAIENLLCLNCWQIINKNTAPCCAICGRQIRDKHLIKRVCLACQRQSFYFDRALSPCVYEGVIREVIHKYKYQGKYYLSSVLEKLLIEFIYQQKISMELFDLVIPIPLHKIKLREREFNQSELLARRIAQEFSLSVSADNLWRKHNRLPQIELMPDQRWKNVKDCFALRYPQQVKDKNILLIDDVLTTGATCSEAAALLKNAGAVSVFVLTVAN